MAYTPTVWNDGDTITAERLNKLERGVANEQAGPPGPQGEPGKDGEQGPPGRDGKDGAPGPAGADGATFTPVVTSDGVLGFTNDKGLPNPDPVNVKGAPGTPGTPGTDGKDGFSPTVTVTDITGGHRVTITDATGPHTFDVMDGQDGAGGGGVSGVSSFNGRSGAVVPEENDYTAEMVGARPSDWMPSATDVGARPSDWMPTAKDVGAVSSLTVTEIQVVTQTEYDSLANKSASVLYAIKE